jgi:hypothetical protein
MWAMVTDLQAKWEVVGRSPHVGEVVEGAEGAGIRAWIAVATQGHQ